VRLCRDRSFFRVAIQEEWGRPTGLLQSLWGTAVRILLASDDSSILIRCPNSMSLLFCMIEVTRSNSNYKQNNYNGRIDDSDRCFKAPGLDAFFGTVKVKLRQQNTSCKQFKIK